jgi:ubiquinol-cytochrome c reductase iron-sulfur subunit
MARLLRSGRLVALLLVAAVAAAIILPAVVRAASSSPTATAAPGATASPAAAPAPSASPSHAAVSATAPATPAAVASPSSAPVSYGGPGAALYAGNCSGCHGDHGQGLPDLGPSQQADAFPSLVAGMVSRGGVNMPAFPQFTRAQVAAVSLFVATQIAAPEARTATVADGGVLYRLYCAGCHGSTGRGGAVSQGRNPPSLADYPAAEALAAMIFGRSNMPVFAGGVLDVREQAAVALYVQMLQKPPSPGGWGLGFFGPVTEGLAAFFGLCLLLVAAVWLAWGKGVARPSEPAALDGRATDGPSPTEGSAITGAAAGAGTTANAAADAAAPGPGWPAALGLLVAIGGSCAFVACFIAGNDTQRLGGTLALAFLGLGFALGYWGRDLTGDEVEVDRYPLPPVPALATAGPAGVAAFSVAPGGASGSAATGGSPAPAPTSDTTPAGRRGGMTGDSISAKAPAALGDELARSVTVFTRRKFLTTLLVGAAAVLGLSQLALAATLGPRSRGLRSTAWRPGARLVTIDGRPITRDALSGGGMLVAFPEGHTEAADSQVALLHLPDIAAQPGRESWSPEGFFAYSRVCTHAGCAVSQYEDETVALLCPCHQSTFDLRDGCRPVAGPAARPLPQLPLAIDAGGFLVAQRDFDQPIGPGFWNLYA